MDEKNLCKELGVIKLAKKFFWLKLKDDFFRDKRIKKMRRIAGGDTYTLIYLKMQLLSLKNEGKLFYEGVEPTFAEEIALEIDEDTQNVEFTIMFLISNGLLEECEDNEFALIETMNSIGTESSSAERVRKHREGKKALQCNSLVTIGNTEIEKEKEKEKEKNKEKETKKDSPKENLTKIEKHFFDYYNTLENLPKCLAYTAKRKKQLNMMINKYGIDQMLDYVKEMNERPFVISSKQTKAGWLKFDAIIHEDKYSKCLEGGYMNYAEGYTGENLIGTEYLGKSETQKNIFTGLNFD